MQIALITSDYWPLQSSCAIQMRDLARELLAMGHRPVVISPSQGIGDGSVDEIIEGVRVLRLASFRTKETSYIRRTLAEILMPITILYGLRKLGFSIRGIDAAVWYSPTIFFGLLVHVIKRRSGCRSYLILRDIFPEWMVDLGLMKKGPVYYLFKRFASYQYSVADVIGVQTPSNLAYLSGWQAARPGRSLEVLQNWLAPAPLQGTSIDIDSTALRGRKIFVYIGNMGVAQGMDILIELAQEMAPRADIGFLFVGRGSEVERLKQEVASRKLTNTCFFNEVESKEMPALLAACDIGLIALDPRHKSHNIPGKFLTYLQAGLPVLARVNADTDLIGIIEQHGVGRVYTGDDARELCNIAHELVDDSERLREMSANGKSLSLEMFSSRAAASQIVRALEPDAGADSS